jgi:ubiquinone/menaquinone biosynthesis C-methylase UbiE
MFDAPKPDLIFETLNAYQRTAALKSAIELDLFSAIAEGNTSYPEIARRCGTAERGARVLADSMTILGFLTRNDEQYALTRDSAMFLDRKSPAYMGDAIKFLLAPEAMQVYQTLTEAFRKGGAVEQHGSLAPDHPIWVEFARSMASLMTMPSQLLANLLGSPSGTKWKVLSLAAGHGAYEIAIARQNPNAEVWAVDWPNVLELARQNAERAGVGQRYHTIPGSALEVDYGEGYDLVLLTNFIHHLDPNAAVSLLKKVHRSMASGGRVVICQFVPNEDRLTPQNAAWFNVMLLATTPAGEAYTYSQLCGMLEQAGFAQCERHDLQPTPFTVVMGTK